MPAVDFVIDHWVLIVTLMLHGMGVLFIFDVIMHGRTSQGTIAWVMALFFFPYLAVFLYMMFGARRIHDYTAAHQSGTTDIHHLGKQLRQDISLRELMVRETPQIDVLSDIYQFPIMKGNRCSLLINGPATFDSILEGIATARHYILIQFFIVHADQLGNRLKAALIERARAGVNVYFLYDKVGSALLPRSYIKALKDAGVHVGGFRVGRGWLNRFRINFRNHRKIVVIDGHRSWVGGHNVGDGYVGESRRFSGWRDTHVKMEGPVTLAVQLSFVEDWHWACGYLPDVSWSPPPRFRPRAGPVHSHRPGRYGGKLFTHDGSGHQCRHPAMLDVQPVLRSGCGRDQGPAAGCHARGGRADCHSGPPRQTRRVVGRPQLPGRSGRGRG